ncbi:MAG: flagellar hook-associated protein FlgL [Phycisphaerae bacterium]|nr:flagellar hook-associated protein FlgL [Phycisphaerae bacterium]
MPSAVRPSSTSRVTMLMQSNMLLDNINSTSVDLLKVQNQLSTGLRLSRPSDDPADAVTIMHLDSQLEQQKQYIANLSYANDFLATTDTALSQAKTLSDTAYDKAMDSIGQSGDISSGNAVVVDQLIDQLLTISNMTSRGAYIFGGQYSTRQPFESSNNGILYTGSLNEKSTRVAPGHMAEFSVDGNNVFGALSSQVVGTADLNPEVSADTLISDLSGALNHGIRKSTILISDGTDTTAVDLNNCITVGDIVNKINANVPAGVTASISASGIDITSASGTLTINELGSGTIARDLGIYQPTSAGATVTGQDVDARLTLNTSVSSLDAGGAGIDLTSGLHIVNSSVPDIGALDISTCVTVGDIINKINDAGLGVRAVINDAGDGINVFNQLSGSTMTIGENGGTTASDLGIRSMNGATSLSALNGGTGVGVDTDAVKDDGNGIIQITDRNGTTYDINLSSAKTVQDVIDQINTVTGVAVTASLTTNGNGIELTDATGGGGTFSCTTISENGQHVAEQLGLEKSVNSNTITGDDVSGVQPEGIFSHLMELSAAMKIADKDARDAAITAAAEKIDTDRTNIINYYGQVGSMAQTINQRTTHMEDNALATETLRSDIRDIDFTEATTRYQNLYTALQANLQTGSNLASLTLLDFLR